jgi:hypothetical protein
MSLPQPSAPPVDKPSDQFAQHASGRSEPLRWTARPLLGPLTLETLAGLGFAVACVAVAAVGVYRGFRVYPDWMHWQEETEAVLAQGRIPDNTAMYGYLPGAFFLLMPFAARPVCPEAVGIPLFVLSNLACIALAGWAVGRHWIGRAATGWNRLALLAMVIIPVSILDPLWANQLSLWVLGPFVAGVALVRSGRGRAREFWGGFLIGIACIVKPIPGVLLIFAGLRRHWRAVGGAVAAGVLLDLLPAVLFFGFGPNPRPELAELNPVARGVVRTVQEHLVWLERTGRHGAYWYIEQPMYYRRSQAMPSILSRWLRGTPDADVYLEVRDPDVTHEAGKPVLTEPAKAELRKRQGELAAEGQRVATFEAPGPPLGQTREHKPYLTEVDLDDIPRIHVAELSAETVRLIHKLFSLAVVAALVWMSWGPGRGLSDDRWYAEAAVWCLSMFWLTPYLTHNYFVWAYPAVAVLCWLACDDAPGFARLGFTRRGIALAALAVWFAGQVGRAWMPLQFYGINQFGTFALAAGLLAVMPPRPPRYDGATETERGAPADAPAGPR